ncbi:bifunctional phosphopantothenoylcysteine decarboxylase/phosphopantothenate--cysteine ligase CoaBC [Cesiribacter andamanensis]|uniref:Coenzyme A biosynthesis bifunctional protein CoaBC n=1 Tax=Cesiribacter andamanensis AMV16 TaxID=1279009 RepID=M7N3I3_9BACT|nr:bifunctional phosphopantothenoylcysteine decarboxylase/phosphopantothenate--cysteine ligase CoaBC [Cesiribacter andamanensis]EMR03243.1 DNA/pantothenate metabolism flavoprotein [Cesiribacter andamanensis AMV16]
MLHGKKILLGVCGSIAAYKAAPLTRLLVKEGAEVQIIMTPSALPFIGPLTLATLSNRPVLHQYADTQSGEWHNHVALGLWADALLVAPATANTLAKFAGGLCDNLLTAVYLSARCPVYLAPAMDLDMYQHPSTRANLERLQGWGHHLIAPETGELASGLYGQGRLAEPETIVAYLQQQMGQSARLRGKKVLITAGPTYEGLDPVRFIGNHSTGRMGFALAEAAAAQGAEVVLVSGPSQQQVTHPGIRRIDVRSAEEMYQACRAHYRGQDCVIFAAAVADYRPVKQEAQKIKKKEDRLQLELEKTVDIAATLGREKQGQLLVGFALETDNELAHARQKLEKKGLDLMVLNSLQDAGAGFGHATNKVTILDRSGDEQAYPLKSKEAVAADILEHIIQKLHAS